MISVKNSKIFNVPEGAIKKANLLAHQRIKSAYKRDKRLNVSERIEKISIGYLGEFGFNKLCIDLNLNIKYLGDIVTNSPDDGDFICNSNGKTIDVKTQEVFYWPKDDWRCEVTDEQLIRDIDFYFFTKLYTPKIKQEKKQLILLGGLAKNEFKSKAKFRPAGTILKGKKVHYPKWDVLISELKDIKELF